MKEHQIFFAGAKIQYEEVETYICRKKELDQILAVFSVGKRRVFYKNEIKSIRYFSDLRIHPKAKGSRLFYYICRFITDSVLEEDFAQGLVLAENDAMMKLVYLSQHRSERLSLAYCFPIGAFRTYAVRFSAPRKNKYDKYHVRRAQNADIPAMQQFLLIQGPQKSFFPYYDFNELNSDYYKGLHITNFYLSFENDQLVGMAGIWDLSPIKQIKINSYSALYIFLRPFINLWGVLRQGIILPPKGSMLNFLSVHSILIRNNDCNVFDSLLNEINNDNSNLPCNHFLVCLDENDALKKSLKKFRNKWVLKSHHLLLSNSNIKGEGPSAPVCYMDSVRV